MKRHRLLLALALLSLAVSCTNPAAPRYPQNQEDTGEEDPPDSQGFLMIQTGGYFV